MANIVLTTHWTSGDVYPFISLGRRLRERGHRVTLLTHCIYEHTAQAAGIAFEAIDTPEEWAEFMMKTMPGVAGMLNTLQNLASLAQNYDTEEEHVKRAELMQRELEQVKRHCAAEATVLVGRHTSSLAALLAAEALNLPIVSVFLAPSQVSQSLLDEAMVGAVLVRDANRIRERLGFPPVSSWERWVNAAPLHIGLWPEWFAADDGSWPVPVVPVGFPLQTAEAPDLAELPPQLQALLRSGARPVLISGGSGKVIRSEFYRVSVEACSRLEQPTLVVTQYKELLPASLPAHIQWYPFLPFAQIMHLMGAIIHHGGIGTINQALLAGIPQLVLAHGLDRPDNAARLKQLGAADALPLVSWQPERIAASLESLLEPAVAERSRQLTSRVDPGAALDRAAVLIEQAAHDPAARISGARVLAHTRAPRSGTAQAQPALKETGSGSGATRQNDRLANLSPDQLALLMRRLQHKKERS